MGLTKISIFTREVNLLTVGTGSGAESVPMFEGEVQVKTGRILAGKSERLTLRLQDDPVATNRTSRLSTSRQASDAQSNITQRSIGMSVRSGFQNLFKGNIDAKSN